MLSNCEPEASTTGILLVLKITPLIALPFFIFAGYILAFKSSKHLQPTKRAYAYFLISKFASLLFLSAGIAPILHTPSWGFQSTGFLRIFDAVNPMWSIIGTMYCHLVMLFFLVQVINTRCEVIEKLSAMAYEEEKKMFFLIRALLKVLYFFILFSFWCLLLTLGFGEEDVQRRLRQNAEKNKAKGAACPTFFFLDTESWRLIVSIISIVFLLIIFLVFSIGYLSGVYHILKKSKMKISKKFWKIQTGFLSLLGIQVTLLFCFLLFLPVCFLALKTPGSESTSLTILLFIAHHGTVSTITFTIAHRFVRSRILRVYNNCVPKPHRVGIIIDADRLDYHSTAQTQVFTVITDTTTV
ncbi:unnamed protein product [Caenorhabditis brenneri]